MSLPIDKRELQALIQDVLDHEPPFAPTAREIADVVVAHGGGPVSATVYGASDDLIEVKGDVREEFHWNDCLPAYLRFSNGVVLRVSFFDVWRIDPVANADQVLIEKCPEDDEDDYTDTATVLGDVTWVTCEVAR